MLESAIGNGEGVVILGNWNARTGCRSGESESEICDLGSNYTRTRNSEDIMLNAEGKKLLKMGEEYGLRILNGSIDVNWEGKLTYVEGREDGSSVLDYVIVKEDEGENPVRFLKIEAKIESDHLPLTFRIVLKPETMIGYKKKNKKGKFIEKKLVWDPNIKKIDSKKSWNIYGKQEKNIH